MAAIVASLSLHIVTLYLLALVAQGRSPWQAVQIAQTDQGAGRHSRRLLEAGFCGEGGGGCVLARAAVCG